MIHLNGWQRYTYAWICSKHNIHQTVIWNPLHETDRLTCTVFVFVCTSDCELCSEMKRCFEVVQLSDDYTGRVIQNSRTPSVVKILRLRMRMITRYQNKIILKIIYWVRLNISRRSVRYFWWFLVISNVFQFKIS